MAISSIRMTCILWEIRITCIMIADDADFLCFLITEETLKIIARCKQDRQNTSRLKAVAVVF